MALVLQEDVLNRLVRKAASRFKRKRQKKLYGLAKRTLKKQEENTRSLKLRLNAAQFGEDRLAGSITYGPDALFTSMDTLGCTAKDY